MSTLNDDVTNDSIVEELLRIIDHIKQNDHQRFCFAAALCNGKDSFHSIMVPAKKAMAACGSVSTLAHSLNVAVAQRMTGGKND